MAITKELVLVKLDDLEPFAEARFLATRARELADLARHADARAALAELAGEAVALAASVAEALRAWSPGEELRRWRDAGELIASIRARAYEAYTADWLDGVGFDQLMAASARCRREVEKAAQATRRRARRKIDFDE
jgi:hypothetical protein